MLIGGSGGGHAVPEKLIISLKERYLASGGPRDLTLVHPVGLGDMDTKGVGHLAYPDLLKRIVTGALVNTPAIQKMAQEDTVEAYTLPQGCAVSINPGNGSWASGVGIPCWAAHIC